MTGVPATVINEERTFVGVPNLDKFVDKLLSEGKEWSCTKKHESTADERAAP